MKKITSVISVLSVIGWLIGVPFGVMKVGATSTILIVELQTGGVSNASSEFVRIANAGITNVDLTGWNLKSTPSSGNPIIAADQTKRATLTGLLEPGATLLLATSNYQTTEVHQSMSTGLVADGHVELVYEAKTTNMVQDLVGWGNASHPEGIPAPKPAGGQSLLRKTNSNGTYIDTDNNQADFYLGTEPVTTSAGPASAPSDSTSSNSGLMSPVITELLPNPASPFTDSTDEYVEIFNPNNVAFNLSGYKLQTGSSFSYSLTFVDQTLSPNSYSVFTSGATPLTLSNTSGAARLLDNTGSVVSQTADYTAAADGLAWGLFANDWQWTSSPTPGAANILNSVFGSNTSSKKSSSSKTKAPATVKSAKTTKSTKNGSTGNGSSDDTTDNPANKPSRLHPLILAGVGGLAVLYGAYEYRHDLQNALYKLRRYRANRREARKTA